MAMLEGTVTINSTTGAVTASTGAAGMVFDELKNNTNFGTLQATNPQAYAAALQQLAVIARAVAKIIPHIKSNAQLSGAVVASGIPVSTTGTESAQTGATTATGNVSGGVT